MPYRTLTNNTPTIDPKLLPTQPTRRTTLVTALTPTEAARRTHRTHQAQAAAMIQTLVTPTSQPPAPHAVFTPHDGDGLREEGRDSHGASGLGLARGVLRDE